MLYLAKNEKKIIDLAIPKWKRYIFHHTYDPPIKSFNGKDYDIFDEEILLDSIERKHESLGWNGIGYHIIIMPSGRIWYSHRWLEQIKGAHCKYKNKNSIGICLFGNMMIDEPSDNQTLTLAMIITGIDDKLGKTLDQALHRDFRNTRCPGENIDKNYIVRLNKYIDMLKENRHILNGLIEMRV